MNEEPQNSTFELHLVDPPVSCGFNHVDTAHNPTDSNFQELANATLFQWIAKCGIFHVAFWSRGQVDEQPCCPYSLLAVSSIVPSIANPSVLRPIATKTHEARPHLYHESVPTFSINGQYLHFCPSMCWALSTTCQRSTKFIPSKHYEMHCQKAHDQDIFKNDTRFP